MATVDPEAVRPAVVQVAALAVEPEVLAAVQVGMVQVAVASAVALAAAADNHLA